MGFVRFVVGDNYSDEYMIYESYRLYEKDSIISFSQKCEESCFYESYNPTKLTVQVHDTIVTITSINLSSARYPNAEFLRKEASIFADNTRLLKVQNYISENRLIWIAEHTKISNLSYSSKAKLWGKGFCSYGFEYYSKGIFSLSPRTAFLVMK